MRFNQLFSEYKILRKKLSHFSWWQKIIAIFLIIIWIVVYIVLTMSSLAQNTYIQAICAIVLFLPFIIMHILSNNPKYVQNRIEKRFKPASEKRLKEVAKIALRI